MFNSIARFFRESYWARFLIPAGLALMIFSIFAFIAVDNTKGFSKTEAEVTKIELVHDEYYDSDTDTFYDKVYDVFVTYTVGETIYENVEYGEFSTYKVGDKITILYDPNDPTKIAQPNTMLLPILILVAGVASFAGGIVSIVVAVKKNNRLKEQEKEWITDGE